MPSSQTVNSSSSSTCGEDLGPGYECQRVSAHSGDCEPFPCPEDNDGTQGGAS